MIGNLYFRCQDYENALKYYYLSEHTFQLRGIEAEMRQNKLTALRRLDKFAALNSELESMTDPDKKASDTQTRAVLRILSHSYTADELRNSLNGFLNAMFMSLGTSVQ